MISFDDRYRLEAEMLFARRAPLQVQFSSGAEWKDADRDVEAIAYSLAKPRDAVRIAQGVFRLSNGMTFRFRLDS